MAGATAIWGKTRSNTTIAGGLASNHRTIAAVVACLRSCAQLLLAQQKTVRDAAAVGKIAREIATRIDPIRIRCNGSRDIDGNEVTLAQEKSMRVTAAIKRVADDSAARVDIK